MPNPSTIAEMEDEIASLKQELRLRNLEVSNLLYLVKEKNDLIKQLHLLLDIR